MSTISSSLPPELDEIVRVSKPSPRCILRAVGESLIAGLICGLMDINETAENTYYPSLWAYTVSGIFLGFRHVGCAWACWPLFGLSLYLVHVAAITGGLKQPYVEVDIPTASTTLYMITHAGILIAIGVGIRVGLSAMGWFRRKDDAPIRFFSRFGVIASILIGISLQIFDWAISPNETVYAPGYSEIKFLSIHEGMTQEEVEAKLGPPLAKWPWEKGEVCWPYTKQRTSLSDFWRRWIFMRDGKVSNVMCDYFYD